MKLIIFSFLNYNGVCGTVTLARESYIISFGSKKHPSSALIHQMSTFFSADRLSFM